VVLPCRSPFPALAGLLKSIVSITSGLRLVVRSGFHDDLVL
jgi:hypothetical protein